MYGIYTEFGALLTRFKADTFEQAQMVMDYIAAHKHIDTMLYLSKIL